MEPNAPEVASDPVIAPVQSWLVRYLLDGSTFRRIFERKLAEYNGAVDKVLSQRRDALEPGEWDNLTSDVDTATRRQAIRDSITPFASLFLDVTYDALLFAPTVAALVAVSGHGQLSDALVLVFSLAVVVSALSIFTDLADLTPLRRLITSDGVVWALLAGIVLLSLAIIAMPFGLSSLWRATAVGLALGLSLAVLWVSNQVLNLHFSYPALFMVTLGNLALLYLSLRLTPTVAEFPAWAETGAFGARIGVGGGAVLGLWLVLIELVNQVSFRWVDKATLSRIPEEEFVQSILWLLSNLDMDEPQPHRSRAWRQVLVFDLDRLAILLEVHIPRQMARLDPRNAANLRASFSHRAAVFHRWKQEVLLGDNATADQIVEDMWSACRHATNRRWNALPADGDYQVQETASRRARWWRAVRRLLVLVPPLGVMAYAIVNDQTGLATAAGGAAGLLLLEFISPGSNDRVAKATNAGKQLEPFLPRMGSPNK